ncbi:MAG: hypothetical protein ACI9H8_000726 [Lysobacterales bacterium]|jgi:hypothetical protein
MTESETVKRPTRLMTGGGKKTDSVQVVLDASPGPGSAKRSGQTKKGGSIGKRDPLR